MSILQANSNLLYGRRGARGLPVAAIACALACSIGCQPPVHTSAAAHQPSTTRPAPGVQALTPEQLTTLRVAAHSGDSKAMARYGTALIESGSTAAGTGYLRRAVARAPGLTAAWHNLALAADGVGWLDVALDAYSHVVRALPGDSADWIKLGYVDEQLGRYSEGEQAFRRAAVLDPGASQPLVGMASAFYAASRYNDALSALARAARISPGSAATFANMAAIDLELGKRVDAIAAIRKAIATDPDDAGYHLTLGQALAEMPAPAHRVEGRAELLKALDLGREDAAAPLNAVARAAAVFELSKLARLSGDARQASALLRQAAALDPHRPEVALALGHALAASGGNAHAEGRRWLAAYEHEQRMRDAERSLRQRVEEHPEDGRARLAYGRVLAGQESLPRAVWELEQAVRLMPGDAAARAALRSALRGQGRDCP